MQRLKNFCHNFDDTTEYYFANHLTVLGKLYGLVGVLLITISFIFIKSSNYLNAHTSLFYRALITTNISYRVVRATKTPTLLPPKVTIMLIVRSIIGLIAAYFCILALTYIPMNEFITLYNTQPLFSVFLEVLLGHDTFKPSKLVCAVVIFIGVALIVNPHYIYLDFHSKEERGTLFYVALLLSISAAMLKAVILIIIKELKQVPKFLNLLYVDFTRVPLSVLGYIFSGTFFAFGSYTEMLFLTLSAFCEYGYQLLTIRSLKYIPTMAFSSLESVAVIYALIADILIFKESLKFGSCVGVACVVLSILYLVKHNKPTN